MFLYIQLISYKNIDYNIQVLQNSFRKLFLLEQFHYNCCRISTCFMVSFEFKVTCLSWVQCLRIIFFIYSVTSKRRIQKESLQSEAKWYLYVKCASYQFDTTTMWCFSINKEICFFSHSINFQLCLEPNIVHYSHAFSFLE